MQQYNRNGVEEFEAHGVSHILVSFVLLER